MPQIQVSAAMLLFLVQFFVLVNAHPSSFCKASVGSPSWPSLSKWKALNHTLSGKLLKPSPYGAVCHPERPEYDAAICPSVAQAWFNVDTYAELPIDIAWSQWANDSCLPWTPEPCTNDGFPVYVVNATSNRDVKKGVDFARENNVRLVVKSTGHDYLGRSTAPNSLSIWTHHMTGISFSKGFKPKGCHFSIDTDAVTFAAGTLMGQLNTAGAARNLTIISGGERTVGYGGYMTGAGHGALSATYGMAADQVLELEIVTPSGDIVTANECKNQDLFWAMRGGGGSTFGVITSTTIKAFPSSPMLSLSMQLGTVPESEPFWDMSTYLLGQFTRLSDLGIAGYGSLSANASVQGSYFGGFQGIFFIPALSAENTTESLAEAFAPILDYISTTWPSQFLTITAPKTYPQFNDFFLDTSGPDYGGVDILVGSRLLDSTALSSSPASLKKALKGAMTAEGISPYLLSGKGVKNAMPRGGSNSVNPAWRKSLVHLVLGVGWDYHSPTAKAAQENLLTNKYVKSLRDLAPNTGAYVNEADPNEPDFQHAFWGANYARLLKIKRKVDPDDVFWCTPCVGNERWKVEGNVLCRV